MTRRGDLADLISDKLGIPTGTGLESLYPQAAAVRPGSPYRVYLAACRSQTVSIELLVCAADALDAFDQCDDLIDRLLDLLEVTDFVGDVAAEGPPATVEIDNRLFFAVTVTATLL